jgi:tetratricopeptide (TPR) repeat protein
MQTSETAMKIETYPNDSPPIVSLIKKFLAEEYWPIILRAMQQDPIVWGALSSATLRQQIGSETGAVADLWAPGNLALLTLDSPVDLRFLRDNPATSIDDGLSRQAEKELEAQLAGTTGANGVLLASEMDQPEKAVRLARSGLAALGLRERYIRTGDWNVIKSVRPGEETQEWACTLACLYTMTPEPYGYLSQLLAPGSPHQWSDLGLHILFSNPFETATLVETSLTLLARLSRTEILYILQKIQLQQPKMAKELAQRMTQHFPTDGSADRSHKAGVLRKLMGEAELFHLAGQHQKTIPLLNAAWKTSTELQAQLAEFLALNLANSAEPMEDHFKNLVGWQPEGRLASLAPGYLALQAIRMLENGRESEANALVPEETNNPQLLYVKARIANSRAYKDTHKARTYAKQALSELSHENPNGTGPFLSDFLPDFAAFLLEINLPYEAAQIAKEAIKTRPNDPGLFATLSRSFAESGRQQAAAEAIELAVLYAPDRMDLRYQLAETLESAGDWAGALQERTTILERVEVPSALELRALANCALHTGEFQLAADVCQQALQIDAADGLAFALLGQAQFELGKIEKAIEFVRQATQLSPHHPTPWLALATLHQKIGDPGKEMETLRTATHAVPDSHEIHLALGKAYDKDNSLTLAVAEFQQAATLAPENKEVALHLGKTLSTLGHTADAHTVLSKAYELTPFDPDLSYAYARVLLEMGQFRPALKALVVVIQSEPENPAPYQDYAKALLAVGEGPQDAAEALVHVLKKDPGNLEAQALLADAQAALGMFDPAQKAYHKLLDSTLAAEDSWHTSLSLGLAGVSLAQNQIEAAIAVLQTARERDDKNPELFRKLADAYILADLREDALEMAREGLRLGADDLETLTWFAGLAVHLDAQAEALSALERAVELAPRRMDLLVLLGHTQLRTGNTQGAWETFNNLFNFENPSLLDLRSAANGLIELEDAETAVQLLKRGLAITTTPDDGLLMDIAAAQRLAGDLEGAIESIEDAIAINKDLPYLHLEKASLLIAVHRPQAATACLQHAINLSPDDQDILGQGVEILRLTGKIEGALELAERRLVHKPEDLGIRHDVADLARALLQPEYALRILREGWPLNGAEQSIAQEDQHYQLFSGSHHGKLAYFNLFADLSLAVEDEISTAEALTQALRINATHPRTLAIQANLNVRKGDIGRARELFEDILTTYPPFEQEIDQDSIRAIDLATMLSIAETGLLLGYWTKSIPILEAAAKDHPFEPLPNLSLARTLVLQAEQQRFCEALAVINHLPGDHSLSDQTYQRFSTAIEDARQGLGETQDSAHINFWDIRGGGAFHPDALASQKLSAWPQDPEVTAARIAVLRSMGDVQSAIEASRAYPNEPAVQSQLALTLVGKDPTLAQAAAQAAADRAPVDPLIQATLSYTAAINREVIIALQAVQAALTAWPDEPRWHAHAAELFLHPDVHSGEHKLSTALAHLEHAARLEPDYAPHFLNLGKAVSATGDIQRSILAFERSCELDRDNPEGWRLLAEAYLTTGEPTKAAEHADRAILLAPNDIAGPILRTRIALQDSQPQEALLRSRAALQIDPQNSDALFLEAQALAELNRPTEALGSIEKALSKAQNPLPLLLERVRLIRRVQGQDAALIALRELNAGYPDNPIVFALLSKALVDTNQAEEAIFAAQQALRKGSVTLSPPEVSELHYLLGRLLRRAGQRDQAVHHLSEAIQTNPINLEPFLELGRTHIDRREYNAALQIFQKGIMVAPDDHRPYYQAGLALKEGKDYMRAEKMLRRAAELSPNDLSIHRLLGAVVALNIVHNREATVDA